MKHRLCTLGDRRRTDISHKKPSSQFSFRGVGKALELVLQRIDIYESQKKVSRKVKQSLFPVRVGTYYTLGQESILFFNN